MTATAPITIPAIAPPLRPDEPLESPEGVGVGVGVGVAVDSEGGDSPGLYWTVVAVIKFD
jgi:hypothetical protein